VVRRIIWSQKALGDLREIHDVIAKDSKRYAEAQVKRIQDTAERTRRFPKIGQIVPELPNEGWRELLSGSYRVIYRYDPADDEIRVLAIVHQRRLMKRSLVVSAGSSTEKQ
jgi:plasmid stabilization system protein ParE